MGYYLSLRNFKHDSGPRRVQSGPDHEDYLVVSSGIVDVDPDNGFVVAGAPLSGVIYQAPWDYSTDWRYIPYTLPNQSGGAIDPTLYNTVSGTLTAYDGYRGSFRISAAGASIRTSFGSDYGVVNPRGGALGPRASVTRPEKYTFFGGTAPSNQAYTPYNTPSANSAAEGYTGGTVTHRNFEGGMLTNVLGSAGTSDRSQWRYHQPVYCKTYTETVRSESPGLMSTPLRYVYRGAATSYSYNYGSLLGAGRGLKQFPDETAGPPVACPTITYSGEASFISPGDVLTVEDPGVTLSDFYWVNSSSGTRIGTDFSYTVQDSDVGFTISYVLVFPGGATCTETTVAVSPAIAEIWYLLNYEPGSPLEDNEIRWETATYMDENSTQWTAHAYYGSGGGGDAPPPLGPMIHKVASGLTLDWRYTYEISTSGGFGNYENANINRNLFVREEDGSFTSFWNLKTASGSFGGSPTKLVRINIDADTGDVNYADAVNFNVLGTFFFNTQGFVYCVGAGEYGYLFGIVHTGANYQAVPDNGVMLIDQNLRPKWYRTISGLSTVTGGGDVRCVTRESINSNAIANLCSYSSGVFLQNAVFGLRSVSIPPLVAYDVDGDEVLSLYPQYTDSDLTAISTNAFNVVASALDDAHEYVYTVGGDQSQALSAGFGELILQKREFTDGGATEWSRAVKTTVTTYGDNAFLARGSLLYTDDKIILSVIGQIPFPVVDYFNVIFIFNPDGTTHNITMIRSSAPGGDPTTGTLDIGQDVRLQKTPDAKKFILTTGEGYRLVLNTRSMPSGEYLQSDGGRSYYFTDLTRSYSDYTIPYTFSFCKGPTQSLPMVSGVDWYSSNDTLTINRVEASGKNFSFGRFSNPSYLV